MCVLTLENVNKTYPNGVRALRDVSLSIGKGMFGLLGPNGAGKSSLMKTIAGLQAPDSGRIFFEGEDIVADPVRVKRQLGFLPQDFGVYPRVTAYALLSHLAVLKGIHRRAERREQVLALLAQTNLYTHRDREVHTFSGGMRQRFGIAQALLGQPRLLIVDEPTAGLDPEERNRFNNLLCEVGEGIVVILSTHIVEDVRNLCDDMAILHNGALLARGKPQDLIRTLDGQIWQKTIDKSERAAIATSHRVLSTQLTGGRMSLHVHASAAPAPGFVTVPPSLEDLYFATLQDEIQP